jgi:FkbM family methyltransferase
MFQVGSLACQARKEHLAHCRAGAGFSRCGFFDVIMIHKTLAERHPLLRARVARALRPLRRLRGWTRVVNSVVPESASAEFQVISDGMAFAGNLGSFLDRNVYLFGDHEGTEIELFLSVVPPKRRGIILDVGANAGTHSLQFARSFEHVHSFEPNPALWAQFERNIALNQLSNVTLHRVGLADRDAQLPFFMIEKPNLGLGTFSTVEQYDMPLFEVGSASVVRGADYLATQGIGPVDAIKIDVQGFEVEAIRGLLPVLERDRPYLWFELGSGTRQVLNSRTTLERLIPFRHEARLIDRRRTLLTRRVALVPAPADLPEGDYIIGPSNSAHK